MLTVIGILTIAALLCAIGSVVNPRIPLWVSVLLLCIVQLLRVLPLGR